jgi:hypothetical protein
MKEVTKEQVQKYTVYEALDGTQFHDKAECEKYEQSALGVIRARITKLTVGEENAWKLMAGSDDNTVIAIKMETGRDLETVKQFLLSECTWYGLDTHIKQRDEIFDIMEKAYDNDDIVLFGINYDGDYYWINSRQNMIDNLMGFGKKEENA